MSPGRRYKYGAAITPRPLPLFVDNTAGGTFLQLVVAICLILSIPTCCTLEQQPGQCSDEPKCAVLDYDDLSTYSITRGVCRDGATCKCLPGDPHSITKAYIYDRSGREYNLSVSNDQHHFNVVLPKLNKPSPGIHTYSFGYDYECPFTNLDLLCHEGKSKKMNLTVKIVDYKLRVDGKSSVAANTSREENLVTYKESVGNNVTLLCSSSLTGDSDTALDIQVVFIFRSSSGAKHIKSAGCSNGEDVAAEANWIISRQQFPPYDCTLTIVDFGSKDIGEYQCAGLLPRGDSQYKHDWSKVTVSLLNHDLPAKPTERKSNYLPLISIAAVLLLFVPFLLYKVYRRRQQDQGPTLVHASSTASLISHRSLQQSYGTVIGSLSTESTSSRATSGNEGELESSMSQHRRLAYVSRSLEEPTTGGGGASSQNTHQSKEETPASTISAGTEGRQYYDQYTDILHADGRRTPEDSKAPLNENFKCHHCGRIYQDDQRMFFARHMTECQQRCPNFNGEAGVNRSNKDTNATRLSDSLTVGPPDQGDPRSRGSTMSEIREGRGYYDDHIEVQVPKDGPTPEESEVPLDNNYSCPHCGKTYHKNQRLYFTRHMEKLQYRCPKYDDSSGSSSIEQSTCGQVNQEQQ